jgi:hypothetical protein
MESAPTRNLNCRKGVVEHCRNERLGGHGEPVLDAHGLAVETVAWRLILDISYELRRAGCPGTPSLASSTLHAR